MVGLEEELKNMDEGIRRLKIEYHVFFNGNRKTPPEDLRIRLERLAKQLSERSDMTQAQRFRYTTLLTRYYTYRSLWRRMMQERERGRGGEPRRESAAPRTGSPSGGRRPPQPFRIRITDPTAEEDKIRNLYDALTRFNKETHAKETPVPFLQFAKRIAAQTHAIRNKHGCAGVAYIVAVEEGAVRFTAAAENP
ncbi:MAG: hypothetical protein JW793_05620 [Acidobacteria bacterium]|nr:hypothetical protein [Acidobacteriota bacterium]